MSLNKEAQGLVYVFTGEGKGKTSAAVGTAVRAVGAGMNVGWVAWYKQEQWKLSEVEVLRKAGVEVFLLGKGFHLKEQKERIEKQNNTSSVKIAPIAGEQVVVDSADEEEHVRAAQEALSVARRLTQKVDVLVMDEVNNAIKDGLLDGVDLVDLISHRGDTHLVITGRDVRPEVVEAADLVTEMKKIKHPYDKGKTAVRGLDF